MPGWRSVRHASTGDLVLAFLRDGARGPGGAHRPSPARPTAVGMPPPGAAKARCVRFPWRAPECVSECISNGSCHRWTDSRSSVSGSVSVCSGWVRERHRPRRHPRQLIERLPPARRANAEWRRGTGVEGRIGAGGRAARPSVSRPELAKARSWRVVGLGRRVARGGRERGSQAVSDRNDRPAPERSSSAGATGATARGRIGVIRSSSSCFVFRY